jgi:tetratricopeptide (TPR) repeat protein
MAESGGVSGILGAEPEAATEGSLAETALDPTAAALAAEAAKSDPELAKKASAYFDSQRHLVDVQTEHLHEQRAVNLSLLKLKRSRERLKLGLQLFVILAATVIGIAALLMIRNAIEAHGVVIDAFQVPPDLAQRGLTGEVIAEQLLDQLADMEAAASISSARPASSYASSWGHDLKVEIPETGVSFGELNRYLHQAWGRESHISGEVYESLTGITVAARMAEKQSKSFSGRTEDLGQLVRKAAESIYVQTQPYRFANYLFFRGRIDEYAAVMQRLSHDQNPVERAWAHQSMGAILGYTRDRDLIRYATEERAALAALPRFLRAMSSLTLAESFLGHDAAALDVAGQCATASAEIKATVAPDWQTLVTAECLASKRGAEGDYPDVLRLASSLSEQDRARAGVPGGAISFGDLWTHDLEDLLSNNPNAGLMAAMSSARAAADNERAIEWVSTILAEFQNARDFQLARVSLERGDPGALQALVRVTAYDDRQATPASRDFMLRLHGLWLALAKARFGDLAGGQALIADTPMDCRMCVDFRGRIAAMAGNTAESEKWFAQAVEMAPKLPQVYTDRGQTRLDRGDLGAALTDATQAATLSPHDGDAWKLWGDVLAKQGNAKEALAKYDEALKYAPNWQQLHAAREATVKQKTNR